MATRANIGILNADKTVTAIYTHNDGYVSHHGPILHDNYTTESDVRALVKIGSLSVLGATVSVKHDFDDRPRGQCNAYGRDRGDTDGIDAKTYADVDQYVHAGEGIEYLYTPGVGWQVHDGARWVALAEAILDNATELVDDE